MLGEVTSAELSEWMAYFEVKQQYQKDGEARETAKAKAQRQGR
jgi:hypothetical protein